jgi:hypothetical protein
MSFKLLIPAILLSIILLSCTHSTQPTQAIPVRTLGVFTEKDFIANKMFFLDTAYLSRYVGRHASSGPLLIKTDRFQVWLSNQQVTSDAQVPDSFAKNTYKAFGPNHQMFKLLKVNKDYRVNPLMGWMLFDSLKVTNNDLIGIHLETTDSILIPAKGAYVDTSDTTRTIADTLWILNPPGQDSLYSTFKLMWRNVYPLPAGFDPTTFNVRIVPTSDTTRDRTVNGILFSRVLGLTDDQGYAFTSNIAIYDPNISLIIIPPFDSSTNGNEPFSNPALGAGYTDLWIYKMVGSDFNVIVPQFKIYCYARL